MKLSLATLLAWIALTFAGSTYAALINVAPTGTATASRTWNDGTGRWVAQNAIDGDNTSIWNAGNFARQWIEIDLGRSVLIERITGLLEQTPPGFTRNNVSLDGSIEFSWAEPTASGQLLTHDFLTPISAQIVRIDTVASPSWVAWREIQIFTSSSVPLPGTLWLALLGLPVMLLGRRKHA